jgi:hypothetical protein
MLINWWFAQLALQRTRFGLWGESVGLVPDPYGRKKGYDTNLDRPDIRDKFQELLRDIADLIKKLRDLLSDRVQEE